MPSTFHGGRWPWSAVLKVGQFHRLQEAMLRNKSPVAFCSMSQSVDFMMLGKHIPTLMTNSVIYRLSDDRREERPAAAVEYLAMQTMPVLLPSDHKAARHFAFGHLLESGALTYHQCRMMAGNGMNVAVVGTAFGFALATIEFADSAK